MQLSSCSLILWKYEKPKHNNYLRPLKVLKLFFVKINVCIQFRQLNAKRNTFIIITLTLCKWIIFCWLGLTVTFHVSHIYCCIVNLLHSSEKSWEYNRKRGLNNVGENVVALIVLREPATHCWPREAFSTVSRRAENSSDSQHRDRTLCVFGSRRVCAKVAGKSTIRSLPEIYVYVTDRTICLFLSRGTKLSPP